MRLKFKLFCFISILTILMTSEVNAGSFSVDGLRLHKKVKTMKELKRANIVTQSLDFSCGAAGLSTLLNYFLNDAVSEQQIINSLLQIVPMQKVQARQGFSLFDLKRYAQQQGYKVTGYKMDFDFLKDLGKPVLVPIKFKNYRHFVIVKAVVADRVFIADPAVGNMSMKIDKFNNIWSNGIGLVVENEGESFDDYALKVKRNDLKIADYKNMRRLIDRGMIRTAVFPTEY